MRILKYVLIGLAVLVGLVLALALLLPEPDTPISSTTFDGKTIRVHAKGNAGFSVRSEADRSQITVHGREVVVSRDGVSVDGKPVALPAFTEIDVLVFPDAHVETKVAKP